MPADSRKARAIFLTAVEDHAPEQWARYLDEACAGDPELRHRVQVLLRAHARPRGMVDALAPERDTAMTETLCEQPGVTIGPYQLIEQLGEGGFGVVWMAEQAQPVRRTVALKLIKPGMDTRQVVARFEAERQALALMDHPNIARVLDAGSTPGPDGTGLGGRPYFVMELVRGVPVTQYCEEHGLTPRQRLELFVSICRAVQHAHTKGIIHRDLKPSNVLVTQHDGSPVVKVIDFGIAKAVGPQLADRPFVTASAQLIGTPLYMSPEQAELSAIDVDTRSDVYSLGVLLYELLTGATPFDRERLRAVGYDEMRRIIREEEPPTPSQRTSQTRNAERGTWNGFFTPRSAPSAPRWQELDWIVMKALEKDRARRYETASAFAADVLRYLHEEPVHACPPSAGYRLRKFVRRNRGLVLAGSLILLTLVAGMVGTTWGMIRATWAHAAAVAEKGKKEDALEAAREQLFLALLNQARAGRYSGHMGQRLDSLDALEKAARIRPDDRLRDEAIAAMALPDVRRVPGWRSPLPAAAAMAYGSRYTLYARVDEPGTISIRTIPDDREVRRIASGPVLGSYLYFSPGDRFLLALVEGYALRVWRVSDGKPALRQELRNCRAHAFSPDGRRLAVGQQVSALIFDLDTGAELRRLKLPTTAHTLAFHPHDDRLAVGYFSSPVVTIFNVNGESAFGDLPVGEVSNQVVAWHPGGERLAVTGTDPRIQIWQVAVRRKVATLEGHVQFVPVVTFHPDGELLASHGWDGMLLLWNASSGRLLMRLTAVEAPRFSADGRWLGVAWNGDRADLLEVVPNSDYRTLVSSSGISGTTSGGCYGDISPDGRVLALGMDRQSWLWDLRDFRQVAALPVATNQLSFESLPDRQDGDASPREPHWRLVTSGMDGVLRWPCKGDYSQGKVLRLGPPEQLSPVRQAVFARGPDGRLLAAVTATGGPSKVLDGESGAVRHELGSHPLGEVAALSSDGRWAASCGWHSDRVRLWDIATGALVHEWVVGKQTLVFFTPDSRVLLISRSGALDFWDVETLRPIRRLRRDGTQFPTKVAFSPDGRLMALEMAPGFVQLQAVADGRTVAQLEDPNGDRATWLGFTPDGTRLVVAASFASAIHVWDLRGLRTRLKAVNLDWDWPEFAPASKTERFGSPLRVGVEMPVPEKKP